MKTNNKQVKEAIQAYILNAIDTTDLESNATTKQQLEFICSEFKRVAVYEYNIKHFKTWQSVFIDWFLGLPSYFDIEVYEHEILNLMASFGLPKPANKSEEEGVNLFNNLIYINFLDLCKKYDVNFYSYLNYN